MYYGFPELTGLQRVSLAGSVDRSVLGLIFVESQNLQCQVPVESMCAQCSGDGPTQTRCKYALKDPNSAYDGYRVGSKIKSSSWLAPLAVIFLSP